MKNLLIYDFRRLLKTKLVKMMAICMVAIPLLVSLFFLGIGFGNNVETNVFMNGYKMVTFIYGLFNYGIYIMVIILIILMSSEYHNRTIRNKIVAGYSRIKVYFSGLISIVSICFSIFLVALLLNFIVCLSIDGSGEIIDLKNYILKHLVGITYIIFLIVLCYFLVSTFKSIGAPLGITMACCIGLVSILMLVDTMVLVMPESSAKTAETILMFFPQHHCNKISAFIDPREIKNSSLAIFLIIDIVYIILMVLGGAYKYNKSDFR